MSFESLNLTEPIIKAIREKGYTTPTPIQLRAIPEILQERDLLGCAQTGTGKTAAFAIPMLQLLHARAKGPARAGHLRALILTPTRELAIQIEENIQAYGKYTGLRHLVIFGGVSQVPQVDSLRRGIDLLVATPGRLLDLISQRLISLSDIEIFVLDEADRMLDMGFVHDVKKIITKLPHIRQTLFFSATMPLEIQKLADTILRNPVQVEVTPVSSTADTVGQSLYFVEKNNKRVLLTNLLKEHAIETCLVFTRTKHGADKVVKDLLRAGITAEAIHGNKSQNARQRALSSFKARTTRVLVATDIAARGIDIDELTHVINYDLPNIPETYVHRIGRTGRAGNEGMAFSFCDAEEMPYLKDIHKLIGKPIPVADHSLHVNHAPGSGNAAPGAPQRNGSRQGGTSSQGGFRRSPQQGGGRPQFSRH
ncbi:MAG: DEAD/DEAH box helicase [Chitinophagaceae bacterium]|nr:DEAD/DEAH box helicase [Chitinophagaceae bacterium]